MDVFFSIFLMAAPLLLITVGALCSELAGRLAMFVEGIIGFGGFLCYTFTVLTGSVALGTIASVLISITLTFLMERISTKLKSNIFLTSLAMNLIFSAITTLLSSVIFGTRGVLISDAFKFDPFMAKTLGSAICLMVFMIFFCSLRFITPGLRLRITGTDSDVLESQGISSDKYKCISWIIASLCASLAGCAYATRLSSFVPGLSGGRGWTALAAVFLGKKNPVLVTLAVFVFAIAEYVSVNLPNIFSSIPSSILLALPYLVSLVLIIVVPQKKDNLIK